MQNQTPNNIPVSPLNLPKGGGASTGMGDSLGAVGPTGMAGMALPLPLSAGRGYAPSLALQYSSGSGNGPFGAGWQLPVERITRRTSRGVPQYDDGQDEYLGPDGEVLVPEYAADGSLVTQTRTRYGDKSLGKTYLVTRYFPRVEGAFSRIERWKADAHDHFWLLHGADGSLHCLGKTAQARVDSPDAAGQPRISQWLLEETVLPTGEHHYYRYCAEDTTGVDLSGSEALRTHGAGRYLREVCYGNRTPAAHLYSWDATPVWPQWLFNLVLDYGERGIDPVTPPPYTATSPWQARQDAFSGYEYGYEIRCHRLCRQVLMYHQFPELGSGPILTGRLLLDYQESPVLSTLIGAQRWAYQDGVAQSLPPLELRYAAFEPSSAAGWQPWQGMPGLDAGQPYQWVDLYGEGLPGVLYRADTDWRYRAPQRDIDSTAPDAVSYGSWESLSPIPSMTTTSARLMDCDGDGRLEWVVTQPRLAGYFTLNPDRSISGFTPFTALPTEFFQSHAQWADLMGTGLADLAMIGPTSVRLYANQRAGFGAALNVVREDDKDALPVAGGDENVLVAFSDVLGSGQPHLVTVAHNGIWCWPNLGRGRFGQRLRLATLTLEAVDFHPQRVFLADIDGSGASDLIYAQGDALLVYFNQSGNGFSAPLRVPLPAGVRFDPLCQLSLVDVQGRGISSLLLSVPYPEMRHWRYDFCQNKPYLLNGINNNRGRDQTLSYRSAAQFWLDDKAAGRESSCYLPFPVHVVAQVATEDEISGNRLTQVYRYQHGVYDGREREFRGFGYVEVEDTSLSATATGEHRVFTPPVLTRTWYHTGGDTDATQLHGVRWQGDAQAFSVGDTRLTAWTGSDEAFSEDIDTVTRFWLHRALKGCILRQEVYGLDDTDQARIPYSVSQNRYQVRLLRAGTDKVAPVVLPLSLETLTTSYERIATDPQCNQQIVIASNAYGQPTHSIAIAYPRRPKPQLDDLCYPVDLPVTSIASSYDDQQQVLRLTEQQQSYWHLTDDTAWQLGLPDASRQNVLTFADSQVPAEGLSFEVLQDPNGLLGASQTRVYAGQEQVVYREQPPASLPALVDHVETAALDDEALKAFDGIWEAPALVAMLTDAGYQSAERLLPVVGEATSPVYVVAHDYTTYCDNLFYLPITRQTTQLTGAVSLRYNDYGLLVEITDAQGNQTRVTAFDYRFLTPTQLVDSNDNTSQVALDAFGRVVSSWFYGTENGSTIAVGFPSPGAADRSSTTVDALLSLTTPMTVASRQAWADASWMGTVRRTVLQQALSTDCLASLLSERLLQVAPPSDVYLLTAKGRRWLKGGVTVSNAAEAARMVLIAEMVRIPPHTAVLNADRYPDATYYPDGLPQQLQAIVSYSDGFDRVLQTAKRSEPGLAWQRQDDGELQVDASGLLVVADTATRWAVSGRKEYDNKGQPVRAFRPYFVNDWRYVKDTSLRACGYADLHFYDPLGRESLVETAKGHQRRVRYFPWFHVVEDENDLGPMPREIKQ